MRTIRPANLSDLLPLLSLAECYYAEATEWDWFELDGDVLYANMQAAILSSDHIIIVAEKDGELVGGLWAATVPQVMTKAIFAKDLFLYVKPEHRDYWTANALSGAYEKWAAKKGASVIVVGANSNIEGNRGAKTLYRRRGYKPLGEILIKTIGE